MKNVLLYGGTGLVGAHLSALLYKRAETERIFLLTESADGSRTEARRFRDFLCPHDTKIEFLEGNARLPRFGLPAEAWEKLCTVVDTAFCCFDRPHSIRDINGARQSDLELLENWLSLLRANQRLRLCYLSTAFVAGRRRGLFTECDLDCGQKFNNPWEQLMFDAECRLRDSPDSERITIFRPSHVIGDSQNGFAFVLTGFYAVLRHLREGKPKIIIGDALTRVDVVPVEYVANAMVELGGCAETNAKTFHLVAGWQKSTPSKEFVRMVTASAGRKWRSPFMMPPVIAAVSHGIGTITLGILGQSSGELSSYRNCLSQPTIFDGYCANAALEKRGISCPTLGSYMGRVLQFAEECKWQPEDGNCLTIRADPLFDNL